MRAWKLPEALREKLAEGEGILIEGESEEDVAKEALKTLKRCRGYVCVGDVACLTLIRVGGRPTACFVDGKTQRESNTSFIPVLSNLFRNIIHVRNPKSHVTEELMMATESLGDCLEEFKTLIVVVGEEDLASLIAAAALPSNCCVVYGVPNKGVKVLKVSEEIRRSARELLSKFNEVNV